MEEFPCSLDTDHFYSHYLICYNIVSVLGFGFWPQGVRDLCFMIRYGCRTPCTGRRTLTHWAVRAAPPCVCQSLSRVRLSVTPWTVAHPPGSSVHGVLQAITLEWAAIPFSRGSSLPRDWSRVSRIGGRSFTVWAWKLQQLWLLPSPICFLALPSSHAMSALKSHSTAPQPVSSPVSVF